LHKYRIKVNLQSDVVQAIATLALFSVLLFALGVLTFIHYPPQGLHLARQADTYSFSLYYFFKQGSFFLPGNLNLTPVDGKCAGEFPIVYYLCSWIYRIFNFSYYPIRIINLLLLATSFCYAVRMAHRKLGYTCAVALGGIIFSSTVLLYYSLIGLPDVQAFTFSIVGLYYFTKIITDREAGSYRRMLLFFTLAGLFKPSYLIYMVACCTVYFIKHRTKSKLKSDLVYTLAGWLLVAGWFIYAGSYNKANHDYYYTLAPKPAWLENADRVKLAIAYITGYWWPKYYYQTTWHFVLLSVVAFPFLVRSKVDRMFYALIIAGIASYLVLFLTQFIHHDYYFITLIPAIFIFCLMSLAGLIERIKNSYTRPILAFLLLTLAALSLNYSRINIIRRFTNNLEDNAVVRYQLDGIHIYLQQNGIPDTARFVVVGEPSRNASLVFLRRFGWIFADFSKSAGLTISNLQSADYLLVLNPSKNRIPPDYEKYILPDIPLDFRGSKIYKVSGID
jgi:4-amino-4-deoxy-L-arabinose transferase-like glycosyltransferase